MAVFEVTSPDGRTFEVTAPEGATKEQALEYAKSQFQAQPQKKPASVSGVVAESIKGVARGASSVGGMFNDLGTGMLAGPLAPVIKRLAEELSAPSRSAVKAKPENEGERFAGTAGEVVGASAVGGGLNTARNAAMTGFSALGGATGEQIGGETGKIVGTLAPGAVSLATTAVRSRLAPNAARESAEFSRAGAEASVGQATESRFLQGLESIASKFFGGSGVMRKFAEKQQAALGQKASTNVSAESAGRAIEKGITGEGGFLARTKATWQQLDDNLAQKVGDAQIAPTNTMSTLERLTSAPAGAENVSKVLNNPKLEEINVQILKDIQGIPDKTTPVLGGYSGRKIGETVIPGTPGSGTLPFSALRELRTKVGSLLDDSLVSGVPGGELKQLYGALSKDLEAAANKAGASQEFARQSNYYSARMDRIESVLERVLGKGRQPEDIFKAVNPTDPAQANKLRAVMRSIPPEDRKVVTDAVVNRLGRATPGRQTDVGDLFSSETFLTNWNRLSPGAKAQLFPDAELRRDMEAIARASSNIREAGKTMANPSGSGQVVGAVSLGAMLATGNVVPAAMMVGAANIGARMLTNQKVVSWIAQSQKVSPQAMGAHMARLGAIFRETKDPALKEELANYISEIEATAQQPPRQ